MKNDIYLYCKVDLDISQFGGSKCIFKAGKTYRIIDRTETGAYKLQSDKDIAYINKKDEKWLRVCFSLIEGDKFYGCAGI